MPRARRNTTETFSDRLQQTIDRHNTRQRRNAELVAEIAAQQGSTDGTINLSEMAAPAPVLDGTGNIMPTRRRRTQPENIPAPDISQVEPAPAMHFVPRVFETPEARRDRYSAVAGNVSRRQPRKGAGFARHMPRSMAKYLDEALLHGEWLHVMVENLNTYWNRSERLALQKIKGHVRYVRAQGYTVAKTLSANWSEENLRSENSELRVFYEMRAPEPQIEE